MDPIAAANIDRRLKLLMERFDAVEARLALLEQAEVAREAIDDLPSGSKPWEAMGVSKATYYRRLRDASPSDAGRAGALSNARPEGV